MFLPQWLLFYLVCFYIYALKICGVGVWKLKQSNNTSKYLWLNLPRCHTLRTHPILYIARWIIFCQLIQPELAVGMITIRLKALCIVSPTNAKVRIIGASKVAFVHCSVPKPTSYPIVTIQLLWYHYSAISQLPFSQHSGISTRSPQILWSRWRFTTRCLIKPYGSIVWKSRMDTSHGPNLWRKWSWSTNAANNEFWPPYHAPRVPCKQPKLTKRLL